MSVAGDGVPAPESGPSADAAPAGIAPAHAAPAGIAPADAAAAHAAPAGIAPAGTPARTAPGFAAAGDDADPTSPALDGLTELVPVGRGGDSTVYRAHQLSPDRDVAVKVLDLTSPDDLRRFERETRITVQLGRLHPNIMKVLDTRRFADGRPCIVMDFYEMGSTHDRLQATGPFSVADVVTIGRVICDALGFAHSRNVLHRDVKPQNILILPTSYVLADFGIARPMDSAHTSSLDRLSYRHASPEVLDGQPPEPMDDLWSLASTLHTLLTGRAPFAADDPADDTALAYLRRVRLAQRRPLPGDIPAALRALLDRAMNPIRDARYPSAADMIADLHALDREVDAWAPGGSASAPAPVPSSVRPVAGEPGDGGPRSPGDDGDGDDRDGDDRDGDDRSSGDENAGTPGDENAPLRADTPGGQNTPGDGAASKDQDDVGDEDALWAPGAVPVAPPSPTAGGAAGDVPVPRTARISAADSIAGIAPSVAGSLAGPVGPSGGPMIDPSGAGNDSPGADAAPTGLRTGSRRPGRGPAGPDRADAPSTDETAAPARETPPRVRTSIVMLAGAMLVVSAIVAYLISRPSGPAVVTPPPVPASQAVTGNGTTGNGTAGTGTGNGVSGDEVTGSIAGGTGPSVPVAGGDLTIDDPELRPVLLSVKIVGNSVTVRFSATNSAIAHVTLVDVTHHDIAADTGPTPPLGMATAQAGVISGTLPAQDDADNVISLVLVGASADFSRRGVSQVRRVNR